MAPTFGTPVIWAARGPMSAQYDPNTKAGQRPHDPADDAALARAIIAGDPRAPAVVWSRYAPLVRRIVRRTLGPDYDVEDVVQDVFLRLFAKVGGLRDPSVLRAFLVSIAIRSVRYELRRRRVRRLVGLASGHELSELRAVNPDPAARAALSRFYRILDRLAYRERTAFVLSYIEELSDAELANALGVSIPTARRASARAYERVAVHARLDPFLNELLPRIKEGP